MYIEDLLHPLMFAVKTNRYDTTLVQSFYEQINHKSLGFTEKQATIMLKISKAYKQQINSRKIEKTRSHPIRTGKLNMSKQKNPLCCN